MYSFSCVLNALKAGHSAAREGWNGKGMSIFLAKGSMDLSAFENVEPKPEYIHGVQAHLIENVPGVEETTMPTIILIDAKGCAVPGWLASQTDMMAEDWLISEEAYASDTDGADMGNTATVNGEQGYPEQDPDHVCGPECYEPVQITNLDDLIVFFESQARNGTIN